MFFQTVWWFLAVYGAAVAVTTVKRGALGQALARVRPGWRADGNYEKLEARWVAETGVATLPPETRELLRRKALWATGWPFLRGVFSCPVCFAFWFAATVSLGWYSPAAAAGLAPCIYAAALADGLAAVGLVFMIHAAVLRVAPKNF